MSFACRFVPGELPASVVWHAAELVPHVSDPDAVREAPAFLYMPFDTWWVHRRAQSQNSQALALSVLHKLFAPGEHHGCHAPIHGGNRPNQLVDVRGVGYRWLVRAPVITFCRLQAVLQVGHMS